MISIHPHSEILGRGESKETTALNISIYSCHRECRKKDMYDAYTLGFFA